VLDLGCGYGRLAPLFSAFPCRCYVGVDRLPARVDTAESIHSGKRVRFMQGDVLTFRSPPAYSVLFTSTVLQHLTIPDKLRLVETMKACRAPGGICILREEEVLWHDRKYCEEHYLDPQHPKHMIPIPFDELAEAFKPLRLERLPKVGDSPHRVYVAAEVS
jgi:SAM-dependent methyltransferase